MFLHTYLPALLLLAQSHITHTLPLQKRDADIESLQGLTKMQSDHSGKGGDPHDKYFHESTFHPHYDGRFAATTILDEEIRRIQLRTLIQTYLATMHDIGASTWIMHGSLLGWWWNRKIMPWDSDIDVQVSESSMAHLARYYNMTVHHFSTGPEDSSPGRHYLLEVNPHYVNGSVTDHLNVIDARWIDVDTGLFIDITTLRRDLDAEAEGRYGDMLCKDNHRYQRDQIFPLRESVFEGMPVMIPFAYAKLLEEEYGPAALTNAEFEGHRFDQSVMEWVPDIAAEG